MKIECIFCGKDMSDEKFRQDYTLVPWRDDQEDPESFNKVSKPAHWGCFDRFLELNKKTSRRFNN